MILTPKLWWFSRSLCLPQFPASPHPEAGMAPQFQCMGEPRAVIGTERTASPSRKGTEEYSDVRPPAWGTKMAPWKQRRGYRLSGERRPCSLGIVNAWLFACWAMKLICCRVASGHCKNMLSRLPRPRFAVPPGFLLPVCTGVSAFFAYFLKLLTVVSFLHTVLQQGPLRTHVLEAELLTQV